MTTLVQLRHLAALAEGGSFGRAAQSQFLTQPALSRSIRALESDLGVPLFDRLGRRTELTPYGREVLARAQRLLADAEELQRSGARLRAGEGGVLRVGLGSGPGAMLMTPLLLQTARERPRLQLRIARGATEPLVQALRARTLDALVVDARSLAPAPDLHTEALHEMRGAFLVRRGHPLLRRRGPLTFDDVLRHPLASTPLSDETARVLVERYGPRAHPDSCVTLRCDELPSLVEVAQHSDTVLLAIRAAAPALLELPLRPALATTARYGLVTLARRTGPPGLVLLRALMATRLVDAPPSPPAAAATRRAASAAGKP